MKMQKECNGDEYPRQDGIVRYGCRGFLMENVLYFVLDKL